MTEREARQAEEKLAGDYLATAIKARQVVHGALELTEKQIKDGTLKDPAGAARNAAITSGTMLDKRLVLQERPTQFIAIDPAASLNALARKVGLTLEGTCEDIEAPQLPEKANGAPWL